MLPAHAKINWTLEVLGRRADDYHEIRSVIQTISLHDTLTLQPAPEFSLSVNGRDAADLIQEENLVTRAASLFPAELAARPVAFSLEKRIPAAAGLGGGSSDAAAALRLLAAHWSLSDQAVAMAAAALGSDVPFFLGGGVQLMSGRGERLEPLPAVYRLPLVLLTPPIRVARKTARLFAELDRSHYGDGGATGRLAASIRAGRAPDSRSYVNVFDHVADHVFPRLHHYRHALEQATGATAMLSGAGPSLFAICSEPEIAAAHLRERGFEAWAVTTAP